MSYAFTFDASACTGCKACQAACKDKNNLPVGVLWRRVIEVSGGTWERSGAAWVNNVFSYNLSMACNHCVHPKCAGVCPTNAYLVREDGIVILDSTKCIGCGYCNWACPYAVPQYNQTTGVMSKCNFCFDSLEAGGKPACVAACPMRILDFEQISQTPGERAGLALWEIEGSEHPFPLPAYSRTQPHIRLQPHAAMLNDLDKTVTNREEIKPQHAKSELPLVAFTLLTQLAVGGFWANLFLSGFMPFFPASLRLISNLLVGFSLGMGMLISFAHLGNKKNAWRALQNLQKSSLSKEILYLSMFGAGWLLSSLFPLPGFQILTALLGLGLVYNMANVYGLRSMAVWNTWRTLAGFLLSACLLGFFLPVSILQFGALFVNFGRFSNYPVWINIVLILCLLGEIYISIWGEFSASTVRLRKGIIAAAVLCLLIESISPAINLSVFIFLAIMVEEVLGRWLFYGEIDRRIL